MLIPHTPSLSNQDLRECLDFANRGLVKSMLSVEPFESVTVVLEKMRRRGVQGRTVLDLSDIQKL